MAKEFIHGNVKIANEILDELAITAAEEVYGVYFDASDNKLNFNNNNPKSAVRNIDGKLHIDLVVNLNKNVNVRKTVKDIQENVKRVIETMTGLTVSRVNINIPRLDI